MAKINVRVTIDIPFIPERDFGRWLVELARWAKAARSTVRVIDTDTGEPIPVPDIE